MANLRLDDCVHCACETTLANYTSEQAIVALDDHSLGCWNCLEYQEGNPDGHTTCVQLFDDDKAIWDGRCKID